MCAILHGPFSIIFILIQPLTVKKLACSTIFYIDSTIPCIRGHKLSFLKSFFLLGISSSKGFDFFLFTFFCMTCSQSFLPENLTMILSPFVQTMTCLDPFPCYANTNMLKYPTTVGSYSLTSIDKNIPSISTHSRQEYWASFQHYLSTDDICSERTLLIFLTARTSDSSF